MLDLVDYNLPLLDEPMAPSLGNYQYEHTKAWAATIARFDGFIFVTAEYSHSVPGVLKNALDYLHQEWNNKAAGFVSYGSAGGVRAAENISATVSQWGVEFEPAVCTGGETSKTSALATTGRRSTAATSQGG